MVREGSREKSRGWCVDYTARDQCKAHPSTYHTSHFPFEQVLICRILRVLWRQSITWTGDADDITVFPRRGLWRLWKQQASPRIKAKLEGGYDGKNKTSPDLAETAAAKQENSFEKKTLSCGGSVFLWRRKSAPTAAHTREISQKPIWKVIAHETLHTLMTASPKGSWNSGVIPHSSSTRQQRW